MSYRVLVSTNPAEALTFPIPSTIVERVAPLAQRILAFNRAPLGARVGIRLVGPHEMHYENAVHKGKHRATDVLSFRNVPDFVLMQHNVLVGDSFRRSPSGSFSPSSADDDSAMRAATALNRKLLRPVLLDLGDIVICPDYIRCKALRYPTQVMPPDVYLTTVLIHGLLHILGYDHEGDAEAARMVRQEKRTAQFLYRSSGVGRVVLPSFGLPRRFQ